MEVDQVACWRTIQPLFYSPNSPLQTGGAIHFSAFDAFVAVNHGRMLQTVGTPNSVDPGPNSAGSAVACPATVVICGFKWIWYFPFGLQSYLRFGSVGLGCVLGRSSHTEPEEVRLEVYGTPIVFCTMPMC